MQITLKPEQLSSKIMMMIVIVMITFKTFYFLRIFPTFTPIVVLVSQVIIELKAFMLFFTILLLMLSQILGVL